MSASASAAGNSKKSAKKCLKRNNYTLAHDPYLEVTYNAVTSLFGLVLLSVFAVYFKWPNFLILMIVSLLIIFISDFPQGQTRREKCLTSTVITFAIWVNFSGIFLTIGSRFVLLVWVFAFTFLSYLITLKDNNRRLHLLVSIVFTPIFIHLLYDNDLREPLNHWGFYQDDAFGLIVCYSVAVFLNIVMPQRREAKAIIACIDFLYALRRVLKAMKVKDDHHLDIYVIYRHLYFLHQQLSEIGVRHKRTRQVHELINRYTERMHTVMLALMSLLNNHGLSETVIEALLHQIEAILFPGCQPDNPVSPPSDHETLSVLNREVVNQLQAYLFELDAIYQKLLPMSMV